MSKQQTYNGWPNYETWNVMLWLDNDEGAYRHYVSRVREHKGRLLARHAHVYATEAIGDHTGDGVDLESSKIRWGSIASAMKESK